MNILTHNINKVFNILTIVKTSLKTPILKRILNEYLCITFYN